MSRRWRLDPVPTVGLLAGAVLAWTGCGQGGESPAGERREGPASEPVQTQPVQIEASAPRAPLVPGELPEGFHVDRVSAGAAADTEARRALLIGEPDRGTRPGSGPMIVVGDSAGSASIAGPPAADGETVPDLGVTDSFDPYIADDGPWTWVVFNDSPACLEDCLAYVAGRGVPDEDLIAVARGTRYDEQGPVVEPGALPDGLGPLVTAAPPDGMYTPRGTHISLRSADGPGRISIRQVDAAPELASLWGFWIDDADGTSIRGQQGWSGQVGATYEEADEGRVWVEDGTVVAVLGWDVSGTVLDEVIDGLRPGRPADVAALGHDAVDRVPTPADASCGSAVLSGRVEDSRWVVGLEGHSDPDELQVCLDLVTPSGRHGGSMTSKALAPVGSLTVSVGFFGEAPIQGRFVYGAAPPGTATVELAAADGAPVALQLSDTGPREDGERWFAGFEDRVRGRTVIARAADGSELARAPALP
jgi:hypothetical protein